MEKTPAEKLHHVAIVNDHGRLLVVPGHLVATAGDTVVFHSVAAGRLTLTFPTPVLGRMREAVSVVDVEADGSVALEVSGDSCVRPGSYTYLAYCHSADDLALGGSQPRIIIYR